MFTTHGLVSTVARFTLVPVVILAAVVVVPAAAQTAARPLGETGSVRGRGVQEVLSAHQESDSRRS